MSFIAGYLMGLGEGGSASSQTLFDRIAALPAVYSFDIADGWRCEVCEDSEKISQFGTRYDNWDEEHPHTLVKTRCENQLYFRMYCDEKLYFIVSGAYAKHYSEWYAANGTEIGELKKTVSLSYSDFYLKSVDVYYPEYSPPPTAPTIRLGCTYTITTDGVSESMDSTVTISGTFLWRDDTDTAAYISYVNAVRRLSDELNKTE